MRLLKFLLVVVLLLPSLGFAQTTSFWTDRAVGVSQFNGFNGLVPLQYAQVRVCGPLPVTASPCIPVATVFDVNGNPLPINGGNFGQITTDIVGRFSFQAAAGNYQIQVAATGSNTPQLSYPITIAAGGSNIFSPYIQLNTAATPTGASGTLRLYDNAGVLSWVDSNGFNNFFDSFRYVTGQNFVFECDSISVGLGLGAGQDYPSQTMLLEQYAGRGTKTNPSVTGNKIADMAARYVGTVQPLKPSATVPRSTIHVLCGINDIGAGTAGATIFTALNNYWTTARADGFKIVAYTIYRTQNMTATQIQQLDALNGLIRGSSNYDYLVDLANMIGDTNDANLFQGDHTHPSSVGAIKIAAAANAAQLAPFTSGPMNGGLNGNTYLCLGLGEVCGVGTQTPANTLDVWFPTSNLTALTNEGQIALTNSDLTVGNLSALLFRNRAASVLPTGRIATEATATGSYIHIQGSSNYGVGINTDIAIFDGQHGRLGIGLYPSQVLDVNGNARILGSLNLTNITNAGTMTVGGGSTMNLYKTVTDTPGAIVVNASTCTDRGVALAGSGTGAVIGIAANYALEANLVLGPAQAVAGTVHYRICNVQAAGNITLAAGSTFNLAVVQ